MAIAPNQKKLIIPGKTDPKAPLYYARDMRTIEEWANALQTGGGGITEITSVDGSVTITDPTGPTVDLSTSSILWHIAFGTAANVPAIGRAGVPFGSVSMGSSDSSSLAWCFGPFKAESGGQVLENFQADPNPSWSGGGATVNFAQIFVGDAAMANYICLATSGQAINPFGGDISGWAVDGSTVGTQLALGSPQTTHLITSSSTTTPYWCWGFVDVGTSGLTP